jgi:hypothetical protein
LISNSPQGFVLFLGTTGERHNNRAEASATYKTANEDDKKFDHDPALHSVAERRPPIWITYIISAPKQQPSTEPINTPIQSWLIMIQPSVQR